MVHLENGGVSCTTLWSLRPWHLPLTWSKFIFSEYEHFAYQIKGNDILYKMQEINLPLRAPLTSARVVKMSKHQNASNNFVLKGTYPRQFKTFFSESTHVAYQIKGNETYNIL